jgi:tryptophan-rich sensory protein
VWIYRNVLEAHSFSLNSSLLALIICAVAAAVEGALAGRGARQRLAELRMPPYSPPFALWLAIGAVYYAMCFIVLRHLLASRPFTPVLLVGLVLVITILLVNASWSILFFRCRDLRASFITFIPYGVVVMVLATLLIRLYPFGALLFGGYLIYLVYATWWANQLWRLNPPNPTK